MKERFIQRYKDAITKYFNAPSSDTDGRMIKNYIISEYEHILEEEFGVKHEDVRTIYDELYKEYYAYKTNGEVSIKKATLEDLNIHDGDDFYEIYEYNKEKWIEIRGYFYCSEDNGDGEWRFESYSGFDIPLEQFIENMKEESWYDIHQESLTHYIEDMTEEKAIEEFNNYMNEGYKPMPYRQLTMETPCGKYMDA